MYFKHNLISFIESIIIEATTELKKMFRSLGKSKIAFLLAILFGISLFFFRGGSRYSNLFNSDNIVAKVSGTPISTTKFTRTLQMNINNFGEMLGKNLTGDEIRSFQIHTLALQTLINEAIFENEYEKIKLKLDESVIAQKTKERIPQLYDDNNKLDQLALSSFLQQQRLKIEDIVQIIDYSTKNKFVEDAFFSINYPSYFSNKIKNYDNHKREFQYLRLPIEKIKIDEVLNINKSELDDQLLKFYEENINKYLSKEERDLEFISVNKENYKNDFIPTDFEIEEYYNDNKILYFENEKRSFLQFNFKEIKDAENFKIKIQKFDDYEDIIKFAEEEKIKFNEFKNISKNEVLENISNPLFNLTINQKSDIIETPLAKHIIILKSINKEYQKDLNDVKNSIIDTISKVQLDNYFLDLSEKISNMVLNGNSLIEISKNLNLKLENINNLTIDYNNFENKDKKLFNDLISRAFQANKEFISDVTKVEDRFIYVFNVKNIYKAVPQDFKIIKNTVLSDWKTKNKIDKIKNELEANKKNVDFIVNLENLYNLNSLKILVNKNFNDLPRNLISNLFNSKKGDNFYAIEKNEIIIGNLIDVIIEDSQIESNNISISKDFRNAFGSELFKIKKISTNDALIEAILNQY